MHQHEIGMVRLQRLKPRVYRLLASIPAFDRSEERKLGGRGMKACRIILMKHRLHERDVRVRAQSGEAAPDHRCAKNALILFWRLAPRAQPTPGGDEDGGDSACHFGDLTQRI